MFRVLLKIKYTKQSKRKHASLNRHRKVLCVTNIYHGSLSRFYFGSFYNVINKHISCCHQLWIVNGFMHYSHGRVHVLELYRKKYLNNYIIYERYYSVRTTSNSLSNFRLRLSIQTIRFPKFWLNRLSINFISFNIYNTAYIYTQLGMTQLLENRYAVHVKNTEFVIYV